VGVFSDVMFLVVAVLMLRLAGCVVFWVFYSSWWVVKLIPRSAALQYKLTDNGPAFFLAGNWGWGFVRLRC
jgi:hypothetical protein